MMALFLPIMPFRMRELEASVAGYDSTGVVLVAKEAGHLRPAGATDDVGLYALVSWLSNATGLGATEALTILLLGIIASGTSAGLIGLLRLCRSMHARAFAVAAAIVAAVVGLRVGDVYVVPLATSFGIAPWFLLCWRRGATRRLALFLFGAGVLLGWASTVRSHAGTGVILLIAGVVLLERDRTLQQRLVPLAALISGLLAVTMWTRALIERRDSYLAAVQPGYSAPEPRHPFWHSVYIGLGYVDNPHVPAYRDEVAMARVEELHPGTPFLSPRYERALRDDVMRIAISHPFFIAQNLAAKAGVVLFYCLLMANIGLLAAARAPLDRPLLVGLSSGALFNALFGLLVVPFLPYLSGLVAFALLFATLAVDSWRTQVDRRSAPVGVRPAVETY